MEEKDQEITFTMHCEEGSVEMTVLYTFFSEMTNAHYMIYAPTASLDAGEQVRVSACRYDPEDLTRILPLAGDEDRAIVQSFLEYVTTHSQEEMDQATQGFPS